MSSWLVSPLGVLVAQFFGVAKDPIVLMLVLGSGSCIAFQLLINECFAAGQARGDFAVTQLQFTFVLMVQGITSATALLALPNQPFPTNTVLILCLLMVGSSVLSYQCALIYYRLVMLNRISHAHAIRVGLLPGIVTLTIYLSYCIIVQAVPSLPPALLLSTAFLPSLLQWLYLRKVAPSAISMSGIEMKTPNNFFLGAALISLMVLSTCITILRDAIGMTYVGYAALIVVALNSLSSVANTITRATFLTSGVRDTRYTLLLAGVACSIASAIIWNTTHTLALLIALLSAQIFITGVIESARRMPTVKALPT